MKHLLLPLTAVLSLQATALCNLLNDPGFETDGAGAPPSTAWIGFANGFVETDTAQQSGGSKALKLFQNFTESFNVSGASQDVLVTPGANYKLSWLARNGDANGGDSLGAGNSALAKIEWIDENGDLIAAFEHRAIAAISPENNPGEWINFEVVDVAPPEAAKGRATILHIYDGTGFDGGASWFDDMDFDTTEDEIAPNKASNLLTNGGLETAGGGDLFDGWTNFGEVLRATNAPPGDPNPDFGTFVLRGLGSAKMFQNGALEPNSAGIYQDVSVSAGRSYIFSALARSGDGGGDDQLAANNSARLTIEWRNAADEVLSTSVDLENASINDMTPGILWQDLELTATAPVGATKARVFARHDYAGQVADEAGSSWFDDLCFRPEIPDSPRPLVFTAITLDNGMISLTWDSLPDTSYSVFRSYDLKDWSKEVDDNVLSQGDSTTYMFLNPDSSASAIFFRPFEN